MVTQCEPHSANSEHNASLSMQHRWDVRLTSAPAAATECTKSSPPQCINQPATSVGRLQPARPHLMRLSKRKPFAGEGECLCRTSSHHTGCNAVCNITPHKKSKQHNKYFLQMARCHLIMTGQTPIPPASIYTLAHISNCTHKQNPVTVHPPTNHQLPALAARRQPQPLTGLPHHQQPLPLLPLHSTHTPTSLQSAHRTLQPQHLCWGPACTLLFCMQDRSTVQRA